MPLESTRIGCMLLVSTSVSSHQLCAATFSNVTTAANINHVQYAGTTSNFNDMTGGAAAGDVDGDGLVDLFVTRLDGTDILYKNMGSGSFQDVSATSGFTATLPTNGAAFGDIDNDGDLDLYLTATGHGRFYMYLNDGNGNFTEDAATRGAHVPNPVGMAWGQSVAFGDYDRDGYLDIVTGDWGNYALQGSSKLLNNQGSTNPGYFTDTTVSSGFNQYPSALTFRFSPRFTDLNNDGLPDLTTTGDYLTSQLFWNNGDGTFTDGTQAAGVGTDQNGMGSTIADFDGDGDLDWFVTAIKADPDDPDPLQDSGNRLYVNNGDGTFHDGTDAAGVRDVGWGWGTSFFDYDNDGDLDLIATNGWGDYHSDDRTTLWRNDDGVFTDISDITGISDTKQGRGLLTFDYDNDGDLDIFVVNNSGKPVLYENDGGNDNDWLRITTEGTVSNKNGIGARIIVDPDLLVAGDEMVREVDGGSNFLSMSEMTAHFGLGPAASSVDVITIHWPSGITQQFFDVAPNTELLAIENYLPGDLNGDGFVGLDDLDIVLGHWNQSVTSGVHRFGDPSGDSFVGLDDLDIILGQWNQGTPPQVQSAIPEPSALAIVSLVAALAVSRCRRYR